MTVNEDIADSGSVAVAAAFALAFTVVSAGITDAAAQTFSLTELDDAGVVAEGAYGAGFPTGTGAGMLHVALTPSVTTRADLTARALLAQDGVLVGSGFAAYDMHAAGDDTTAISFFTPVNAPGHIASALVTVSGTRALAVSALGKVADAALPTVKIDLLPAVNVTFDDDVWTWVTYRIVFDDDTGGFAADSSYHVSCTRVLQTSGALAVGMPASVSTALRTDDTFFVEDRAFPPLLVDPVPIVAGIAAVASAWTCATDSLAMTRFLPYEFTGLAAWGGNLYGTTDYGLVTLDGDTDDGQEINVFVQSHITDFGTPQLKLAQILYLGYSSERPLTVTMAVTDSGAEERYAYTAPPRAAATYVSDRIPLGRGLRSRYMRYAMTNSAGGDFTLSSAMLALENSKRRV